MQPLGMAVCTTPGEQWDQHDESSERDEDEERGNDNEEVQPLVEEELEALAAVSHANRTLIQARQASETCMLCGVCVPRCLCLCVWRAFTNR